MKFENLDERTCVDLELGLVKTRFGDLLNCQFRFSPREGGSFEMIFAPQGKSKPRICSLQITSFQKFVDILKEAAVLFEEADRAMKKNSEEAKDIRDAIERLTE